MEPIAIDQNGKKGYQIIHRCLKCGKKIFNKTASDDSIEMIAQLMQRQNIDFTLS